MPAERTPTRTGANWRDSIIFTINGVAQTGLTNAAFTFRLSKDGVAQAVTHGVTLTLAEIGNGEYTITVSGSTGFTSAAGLYVLQLIYTANPIYRWSMSLLVGDGTFADTTGSASFVAVASNGRVTDGASALTAVSIYVVNSANVIVATDTSDASGLWGPIYLDTGTFTILAQKGNYTSAQGTITVAAGVATGPGTDLALTAVSTSVSQTMGQAIAYARRMASDNTGAKANAFIEEAIHEAMDSIAHTETQPWYNTESYITLAAPYSTGSISISGTTVTLSGGTFPTDMTSDWCLFNSADNQHYRIVSRNSGTGATIETTPATTTSAASYVVYQSEYAAPTDILRLNTLLWQSGWTWGPAPVPYSALLEYRRDWNNGSPVANCWAFRKDRIALWPYPIAAQVVKVGYVRRPARTSYGDTSTVLDIPPEALELFRCGIDRALFRRGVYSGQGKPEDMFDAALARLALNDRKPSVYPGPMTRVTRSDMVRSMILPAS